MCLGGGFRHLTWRTKGMNELKDDNAQKGKGRKSGEPEESGHLTPVKKKRWLAVLLVAIAAVCVTIGLIVWNVQAAAPAPQPVREADVTPTPSESPAASASATPTEPQMLPSMKKLYDQNSDIAGWIKIEGTEVDYPVMYTPQDGEYYLYRNFEKEEDPTKEGCIFIDKNCTVEPRSTNLLIHGHNMKNGTMFHTLLDYREEEFYQEHKRIRFDTLYSEDEYEIAAVFLTKIYNKDETDVFKFYQFYDAKNEEEFDEFISNCKEKELYETGVTPEYGDELITLSTCEYSTDNGRIVVVARKVTDADELVFSGDTASSPADAVIGSGEVEV